MLALHFCPHAFLDQIGGSLTKTACRKVYYVTGGSWNWPTPYWHEPEGILFCFPVMMEIGLAASESKFDLHSLSRVVLTSAKQCSSCYGHGPSGIRTSVSLLFFQFSTSPFGVQFSWPSAYTSTPWHVTNQIAILTIWLIYLALVGDPPYPGFNGCFLMHHFTQYLALSWVLLIVWDTRKSFAFQSLSSDSMAVMMMMILVPAVRACKRSWFGQWVNISHVPNPRQIWGKQHPNTSRVSRR